MKLGKLNARPHHLSWILRGEMVGNLDDILLDVQLFSVKMVDDEFAEIVEYWST